MKHTILAIIISLLFVGCGGGGGGSDSSRSSKSSIPSDSFDSNSYQTALYMLPSISSDSISSRSIQTTSYSADYRALDSDTIIEIPQNTPDEKVVYKKTANYINVTLYKDQKPKYSYYLKKTIHLGESITQPESSCLFVNTFSKITLNNTTYKNVIEIDCGKHKAYYAKGEGLVAKE